MNTSRAVYDLVGEQLFTWEGWDPIDDGVIQYTGVVTRIPFGDIPVGTKLEWVGVSFEHGLIQLPWEGRYYEFELNLVVGKLLGKGSLGY